MDERPEFGEQYLVGIEQVDREHRQLFEIAARVHDRVADSGEAALQAARVDVAELIDYTRTHFASEESLMAAAGYPGLAEHRELHQRLLSQVHDMEMRVELGERYVPVDLSRFLYNWLVCHIRAHDRRFGEFLARRG